MLDLLIAVVAAASGEGPDLYQAKGHDHGQEEGEPSASPFFQGHGSVRESFVCHHFVLLSTFEHWEDRNTGGRASMASIRFSPLALRPGVSAGLPFQIFLMCAAQPRGEGRGRPWTCQLQVKAASCFLWRIPDRTEHCP